MMHKNAMSEKISKIMHEGVRRNTRKPVSKKNPRRKVGIKQAVAIANSMARKGKLGKEAQKQAMKGRKYLA